LFAFVGHGGCSWALASAQYWGLAGMYV
jgi:hypothetical protein